jgi:uncharacterized protein YndB with AHSA1/START domain
VSVETGAIVRSVEIQATPERLWSLLTRPEELVRWWPDVADFEPREGGRVRMVFEANASVVNGRVTRFDPPTSLGFTWEREQSPDAPTQVEFTVTDLGGGTCRVEVVHSGWEAAPELRPLHDAGWSHFLACLAALGEGRPFDKTFRPKEDR